MPRFHLHLYCGGRSVLDDEGGEYKNLDEAIGEAAKAAREIIADRVLQGEPADGSEFRIVNGSDENLATIRFEDVLAGKAFPPPPRRSSSKVHD